MIKNIVYDFGYVLAGPKSGNWFIPPNYRKIIGICGCLQFLVKAYKIGHSLQWGHKYLNDNHLLFTEEEEFNQFTVFYERILSDIGIKKDRSKKAELLAWDTVYNDDKFVFYDDVMEELHKAKKDYRIAVLSDTWPSLKRVFDHQGINALLEGLVMSCDYGICKDNIELFYQAASKLDIKPEETLFIDDSEVNLDNAKKAGFIPIRMDRKSKVKQSKYPLVHNLAEAYKLIESYK